ncbi:MAG: hypothetical protein PHE43_03465 [Candidatus Nanoarchaeia archaeon]|nr:hypothetical protein [Candidatus Nanoarchaeia archaeon]
MVDKKGVIKTFEAVFAIVLILIFIYAILPRHTESKPEVPYEVKSSFEFLLDNILTNNSLRDCLVNNPLCRNQENLQQTVIEGVPTNYEFAYVICQTPTCLCDDVCVNFQNKLRVPGCNDVCINSAPWPEEKSIYMGDVFVASYKDQQDPKIFRIWVWGK